MPGAPDPNNTRSSGVIVTGGSSGLGKATALLLAQARRPVAVWGTDATRTAEVAQQCESLRVAACGVTVDLCNLEAVRAAVAASRKSIGPIGGVVCSAARLRMAPVGHLDFAEWDVTLRTNLTGVAYTLEAALPLLREVGRGASFVAVSSTEGLRGSPYLAAYAASKHGVVGLVRSASRSLAAEGIRVNAVCAGAMDTPMMSTALGQAGDAVRAQMIAQIPLGYIADPEEVAEVVCFLLSPAASYVTGVALPVDGGMIA